MDTCCKAHNFSLRFYKDNVLSFNSLCFCDIIHFFLCLYISTLSKPDHLPTLKPIRRGKIYIYIYIYIYRGRERERKREREREREEVTY